MPDLPPENSLLFAYGTLQRGGVYHPLLERCEARFIGEGRTVTAYPLVLDAYPCLLDQAGSGFHVIGEIYRIPAPADWINLDRLEGHPHEYERRPETLQCGRQRMEAWTYFFRQTDRLEPGLKPVERFVP